MTAERVFSLRVSLHRRMSIPVVDFAACSLRERDVADGQMHHLREQLESAFTKVGFVFLENTGITQEEVRKRQINGTSV